MVMTNDGKYTAELISEVANALDLQVSGGQISYTLFCDYINHLITTNFQSLLNILYRLDVSEQKINNALSSHPGHDAGQLIADLILERQIEKIKTRKLFNRQNDVPDEDKW